MKKGILIAVAAVAVVFVPRTRAESANSMKVSDCWVQVAPGAAVAAGYFSLTNIGNTTVSLVGATSPAFGMAMLHRSRYEGGIAKMMNVGRVPVPAHATLTFSPGGYHVMLEEPRGTPGKRANILLALTFSNGEQLTTQCVVKHP
ncbi:copper chaperone PCu(A)C [Pandoraea pulmonicola]|uniref:Uncharacterized protein conserved in bacteria n=1 Tax=Pandoraea pulmonicola TaxID=93221 RepID=A0AAJ4Z841_PANPU|nr:copper chaperone PCu(A)C [Pandoraea pulmonicola]AJC23521.1 hypothetical protein RO07_20860 [Pandoraea pulmonicola]SUA88571.1 Uncharacterized protein conserved in bacteria [Pandoraea pulmonicola]